MYTTILYATDLEKNHFELGEKAVTIATLCQASLHLLHVIEPPSSLQLAQSLGFAEFDRPVKENAQIVMKVLGESLNIPITQQHVAIGSIKMNILDIAKELSCDLIIIGSHASNTLPSFLGSTAHAVVNHASCDVLTLRAT